MAELILLPSFPNSIWERDCPRNSVAFSRVNRDKIGNFIADLDVIESNPN
jgi:hypothetical protein